MENQNYNFDKQLCDNYFFELLHRCKCPEFREAVIALAQKLTDPNLAKKLAEDDMPFPF